VRPARPCFGQCIQLNHSPFASIATGGIKPAQVEGGDGPSNAGQKKKGKKTGARKVKITSASPLGPAAYDRRCSDN
jgi:hypothetical protein